MVININYKKIIIACVILTAFLCITAVGASDINQTATASADDVDAESLGIESDDNLEISSDDNLEISDDDNLEISSDDDRLEKSSSSSVISTSSKVSSDTVFIKDSKLDIQILDGNGKGIAKKQVQINFKGKTKNLTTNKDGHVFFKLYAKGTYKLTYTFKNDGYAKLTASKTLTIVGDSNSKLTGSNYVAYVGIKNPFTVQLTAGGINLPNKKVIFKIKGKTYTKTTDSKGKATLNINMAKGKYTIKYSFKGVENAKAASGSSKITVKKGVPTQLIWQNAVTYIHQVSTPFILKYKDVRGDPIAGKTIVFKINGKTFTKKTDKKGLVTFYIKQNAGVHKGVAYSYATNVFKKSTNKHTFYVKTDGSKNNGFWLFGSDMKKVDLSKMARYGTKNIFLNFHAVELYGKTAVSKFACDAKDLGINVHIWMQAFYKDGSWISPVNNDGTYKYSLFNSIINDAKSYASIKGVAGIHFDYLRFPGTAYKHSNGVEAINYFTKEACEAIHKQNSKLMVSAAIMPEPSVLKYYYGQDVPTLSKYLDVIVPMVYKGNYNQGSSWIKSVTSTFVDLSNSAQVWTGLQGYVSDSNVAKLSATSLTNDVNNAMNGGAKAVIIFRYSLFNYIDFNNV